LLKNLKKEASHQGPITHQGRKVSIFFTMKKWEDKVSHGFFFLATFDESKTFFRTDIKKELITMFLIWAWCERAKG
jgi:hypothetical protein